MTRPTADDLVAELRALGDPKNVAGMARFGIRPNRALGTGMAPLRKIARRVGRDHALARDLWATGIHEARILAALVDEPDRVTPSQMDRWARAFDSWDVCDQACSNLFDRTPHAWDKAHEWATREAEFEKRAAFALVAATARHAKGSPDAPFLAFLPVIRAASTDERNYVKKAVSWALREIGKRNAKLRAAAVAEARALAASDDRAARWIGKDTLRDLTSTGESSAKQAEAPGRRARRT